MKQPRLQVRTLEDRLTPAIATWDGGGGVGNNLWSVAANWAGDVAPQPGDDLAFGSAPQKATVNNFAPGTAFRSITLNDTNYQLSGNAVTLSAGIIGTFSSASTISLDLILGASQTFSLVSGFGYAISGGINLNGQILTATINGGGGGGTIPPFPGIVTFSGAITGAGGIIKDGTQILTLSGNNSFVGPIDHRTGTLTFASNNAGGATGPTNQTQVEAGAVLAINGNLSVPESITLVDSAPGNQNQLTAGNPNVATVTGPVTVQGRSRWLGDMVLAGGLFGPATASVSVQGNLRFPAGVASNYSGSLNNETGRFVFDNTGITGDVIAVAFPLSQMTVAGTGTIGPLRVEGGANLRPGEAGVVGTLTTGSLIQGGVYEVDLSAAGNDKVVVNGTVTLANTLAVIPAPGFIPPANAVYRIIDNDGNEPVVGAFAGLTQGALVTTIGGVPLYITYHGGDGNDVELTATQPPPPSGPMPAFSVGAGPGGGPQVNVYDDAGNLIRAFFAYEANFTGGVHVATADVTGDGVKDVITAPGFGGGPVVRIWDGVTGNLLTQYLAYDQAFRGGVYVAAARIDNDSVPDVITGAGPTGGPHVKVFIGSTSIVETQFFAYDASFLGGVSVGGIDSTIVGEDAFVPGSVITGAGPGGGPHVKRFDGLSGAELQSFFAFEPSFTGGVYVAGGRFNSSVLPGDNIGIVVSPGAGAVPQVKVFDSTSTLRSFFQPYDTAFLGGVTVAFRTTTGGVSEIVTGAGPGGGPHVKQWDYPGPTLRNSFFAFDPAFTGGVFVG